MPLISIIIPCYKVEKYLDRCLESVVNQTYDNLEIILVDDGSPDNCPAMCDEWASKDSRITAIHKENGGLSSARNAALDVMNGEYLMFVDSDDYIAENAVELMYNRIITDGSDLAICNYKCVTDTEDEDYWDNTYPVKDEVLDCKNAHEKINLGEYWHFVISCCKLYKSALFDNFRFPVGKLHEDMLTSHLIIEKCKYVSCISDALYFYYQNTDSITHSYSIKRLDIVDAYFLRFDFYYEKAYYSCAAANLWNTIFKLISARKNLDYKDDNVKRTIVNYKREYNKRFRKIIFKKTVVNRYDLMFYYFGFYPYRFYNKLRKLIK